ncbi:hypothetical protein [Citromicrobium sp. RCC1897]|uniref:hypothetical protein n=1 Tax=Citromicrobium sp. RCC1897 TaxID=1812182 RepID=UPI00156108DE|nr:hypothetical protein [Citromicrobium sp. RCC1897]|tara:strand:- start:66 stop:467 length:402 start_codon:yes stop_codon:yes gene_type:complete
MRAAAPLLLMTAGACVSATPAEPLALSSAEVWERHHELDGQKIVVEGWLQYCKPLGCRIADSKDDRDPGLSIASSASFDRSIDGLVGQKIRLSARLDAECLHVSVHGANPDGSMIVCTDRASELREPMLLQVL